MPMTKAIQDELGGKVELPPGASSGTVTKTGLLKSGSSLVITPVEQTEPRGQFLEEEPTTAEPPAKKGRGRRKADPVPVPEPPKKRSVMLRFNIPGIGVIPSSYANVWRGPGIVVLGLVEMSYVPTQASVNEAGDITGIVELENVKYVYLGNYFTTDDGVKNLILMRVPETREEDDYDGKEV